MADKRTYDLDIQASLDLDQSLLVDDLAFGESKRILIDTLLRTKSSATIDATGLSTQSVPFTNYTVAIVTINQNCNLALTQKSNETCYLKVNKGSSDLVTFYMESADESKQIGETVLLYEIKTVGGTRRIKRINNYFEDSLVIGNLTPNTGTITTFNYFNSIINNNVCNFEGSFILTPSASTSALTITISSWDVSKYNTLTTPISINSIQAGLIVPSWATISGTSLILYFGTAITAAATILINGSFRIK